MKISRNKKQFQISFDSNNQISNIDREEEKDIIDKFIQPCPYFQFPTLHNEEIEKFKKKVIGSANQYGTRNEKTTAIFLSLLEFTREIATNELKKKQYNNACSYYVMCLGFIDPDDELFLEKFVVTKIDIVNKLLFSLFELKSSKNQMKHLECALPFLQEFLEKAKDYAFQSNLIKSDTCMLELNYFYLGRIHRKRKNNSKAISAFLKCQEIITEKKLFDVYEKNLNLKSFSKNLEIKTFYKLSKCYRDDDVQQQAIYEGRALREAEKQNPALFQYLNKKVRMYKSARKFNQVLFKLDGKKKIEDEVLKYIEQSSERQYSSLYDVYKDRPNTLNIEDSVLRECYKNA